MQNDTYLITGSGGCIGAWVIRQLLKKNAHVVAVDLNENNYRAKLLVEEDELHQVNWQVADIRDLQQLSDIVEKFRPTAIIHLAALQVPFCIANPTLGAQVNVVGTINVFEVARKYGVKRISYASSVAATASLAEDNEDLNKKTLYGAYKVCNELSAQVYFDDWGISSVCIRPGVIYGVARDQGMSALPSLALLAGCVGKPYEITFSGDVGFVYAENIANAFIQAVSSDHHSAEVFSYDGEQISVESFVDVSKKHLPDWDVNISGNALPFPSKPNNQPLINHIGTFAEKTFEQGIVETINLFQQLVNTKTIDLSILNKK